MISDWSKAVTVQKYYLHSNFIEEFLPKKNVQSAIGSKPHVVHSTMLLFYSYRSASIGSSEAAFHAG